MGVPKFFRWLSERYPRTIQRIGREPELATIQEHFGGHSDDNQQQHYLSYNNNEHDEHDDDPLSYCLQTPPIDNLYIDMNGIIHGCSHDNNNEDNAGDGEDDTEYVSNITEEEIFTNICYYLDRIVSDIACPKQLVYMAIDGVAPRAKLNQQRARRYRSGKEGDIETTIYDAHLKKIQQQSAAEVDSSVDDDSDDYYEEEHSHKHSLLFEEVVDDDDKHDIKKTNKGSSGVEEVEPGRFSGKFLATLDDTTTFTVKDEQQQKSSTSIDDENITTKDNTKDKDDNDDQSLLLFHSNYITPGTPFFQRCTAAIIHFIQYKLSTDEKWSKLKIVFSGPNVPGEGEHKIMDFIRQQRCSYYEKQQKARQANYTHKKNKKQQQQSEKNENDNDILLNNNNNDNNHGTNTTTKYKYYHPNTRHCIMGQDGDLIMLGLLTHEPNLTLLREKVYFGKKAMSNSRQQKHNTQQNSTSTSNLDDNNNGQTMAAYIHNSKFELLHMNVLRDYLALEFETTTTSNSKKSWDLERCLDDFVFLTFFVGNDFLPHMPAVDIADEAFDLLFYTYREQRKKWQKDYENNNHKSNNSKQKKLSPYLTDAGNLVSGKRLEDFLQALGKHETAYMEFKKSTDDQEQARKVEAKYGMNTIPSDEVLLSKEKSDRAIFRERIANKININNDGSGSDGSRTTTNINGQATTASGVGLQGSVIKKPGFAPVLSARPTEVVDSDSNDEEISAEALREHMEGLLRVAVEGGKNFEFDDQDLKGRYYSDKFGFSPFDADKHLALRKAYIEGLVWNLKYYYEGCVSWEWYYPYHYGPMLSDLVGIEDMLQEIDFEGKMGKPLRPYEQLMACMPPSFASQVLPEPYQDLMTDPSSPIADFYPQSFTIDMNGKRWPWEAVVLLPFIDSSRLLDAVATVDESQLAEDEKLRNEFGGATVFYHDANKSRTLEANGEGPVFGPIEKCTADIVPFESSELHQEMDGVTPVFKPMLHKDVQVPLPGYPTLRDGTVQGLWRKLLRVNVHGTKSRYKTACLEIENPIPEILPAETLASHLIGTLIWINYPHFVEAFVTAVSDSKGIIRGKSGRRMWSFEEAVRRKQRVSSIVDKYVFGEKLVGTGGVSLIGGEEEMDELDTLLYVRPFSGLKTLEDGSVVKTFAKFEIEVPLFVTGWVPQNVDLSKTQLPARLERDPYTAAKFVLTDKGRKQEVAVRGFGTPGTNAVRNRPLRTAAFSSRGYHSTCFPSQTPLQSLEDTERKYLSVSHPYMRSVHPETTVSLCIATFARRGLRSVPLTPLPQMHISRKPMRPVQFASKGFKSRLLVVGVISALSFFSGANAIHFGGSLNALQGRKSHPLTDMAMPDAVADGEALPFSMKRPTPALEFAHGTTTLSFVFQGGIVAAVDSRASLGSFVGSKTTQKVLPINSHILGTMAGGAADCSFWIRRIRCEAAVHELEEGHRMSVAHCSRMLSNILYQNRGLQLSVGTMIMGFDDEKNQDAGAPPTPKIFYVDNSGLRIEGDLFAVGSGSTLALGILDRERRYDMSVDEAVALGIKAIRHATFRDAYSGGFINVYLITTRDGWKRVFTEDLDQLASLDNKSENVNTK